MITVRSCYLLCAILIHQQSNTERLGHKSDNRFENCDVSIVVDLHCDCVCSRGPDSHSGIHSSTGVGRYVNCANTPPQCKM